MLTTITAFICLSAPAVLPARVEADYGKQKAVVAEHKPLVRQVEPISRVVIIEPIRILSFTVYIEVQYKPGCV